MNFPRKKKSSDSYLIQRTIAILLFVFIFLFLRFKVDPRLLFQAQEPPFLCGIQFLSDFLQYPGGLAWYISAFFTQFYIFPWTGALIITFCIVIIYWQAAQFNKSINIKNSSGIFSTIPSLALFAVYVGYTIPLTYMICLFIALLFFNLYKIFSCHKAYARLLIFTALTIISYYTTGIGALLFAILCALNELLIKRNYLTGTIIIGIIAPIPYIAARLFFVILVPSAYYDILGLKTYLLDAAIYPRMPVILYGVYGYFPAVFMASRIISALKPLDTYNPAEPDKSPYCRKGSIFNAAIIIMSLVFVNFIGFDKKTKINYQIDYYASHRLWHKIKETITPANINNYSIASQTQLFRALYYENILLSDLFSYPGGMPGMSFEMIINKMSKRYPLLMCDLSFDAGALNTAEYWANEALAMQGKKTGILQRLALINALKGHKESTEKYIALLDKTILPKKNLHEYELLLNNGSLPESDEYLKNIKSTAPKKEYICRDFYWELANLMNNNNKNRLAMEYLMAQNLLNNNISGIVDNIVFFGDAGYKILPRHIQEAVVFQVMMSNSNATTFADFQLDNGIFRQFTDFNTIMQRYGPDRAGALKSSYMQFGNTYWYYMAANGRTVYLKRTD